MPARAASVLAAVGASQKQRVVVWLRNDLRLHDSAVFNEAAALAKQGQCEVRRSCP
jgi:hypothetical protein